MEPNSMVLLSQCFPSSCNSSWISFGSDAELLSASTCSGGGELLEKHSALESASESRSSSSCCCRTFSISSLISFPFLRKSSSPTTSSFHQAAIARSSCSGPKFPSALGIASAGGGNPSRFEWVCGCCSCNCCCGFILSCCVLRPHCGNR